jgi:hypothetical protein
MKDALLSLRQQKRKSEQRVTNDNKQSIINQINKYNSQFDDYIKLTSKASVQEVNRMKKQYQERLTYDIVTLAIQQGKDIVAEIEARDLKKSADYQTRRLREFAKDLARARKETNKGLTKEEKQFLERGNANIKGFGNEDIITLFEKTKTKGQAKKLIDEIIKQDPKQLFYEKQLEIFERSFQKVGIVREEDLQKIKDKLNSMDMNEAYNQTNELLRKIEVFDYEKFFKDNVDETEIAHARLDDVMIKMGLKKNGVKKVQRIFEKYKKE